MLFHISECYNKLKGKLLLFNTRMTDEKIPFTEKGKSLDERTRKGKHAGLQRSQVIV